jgi:ribosomal protein S12 methylthiotransferase accessory factor
LDLAVNPPCEGLLPDVDTNGLAAGNTHLEAVVHGLCEVIERDCLGQYLFVSMFADAGEPGPLARRIDLSTLPESAQSLMSRITASGQTIEVTCITSEIAVPVFRSALIDHHFPVDGKLVTRRFLGFGASPNAELSLLRSMTEAVQSRVAIIQGARDSYNALSAPPRYSNPAAFLGDFKATQRIPFTEIDSFECEELQLDLQHLLTRLRSAGFDSAIVIDLSREGICMPVVRVRVPGLTSYLSNRRRAGWRCMRYLL